MAKKPQTGKQKANAAKAAGATGTAGAAATAAIALPSRAVATVNAKAMSADVGPFVVAGLAQSYVDEAKAHDLMRGVAAKRYDLMAQTTAAIVKAAQNDKTIDLAAVFSGDAKKVNFLNDQIRIAMGICEPRQFEDAKGNTQTRIVYSKAVAKFFPSPADAKGSDEAKRKGTLRSNFVHTLKKCTQAAVAIIDRKIDMEVDKDSGTLLLSGPAIKKQFGADEVLLNEKQTVGEGDNAVKLIEKPSFTALAAAAGTDHGAAVKRGGNVAHRGRTVGSNKPDALAAELCKSMLQTLGKLKKEDVTDKLRESLDSVASAIATLID